MKIKLLFIGNYQSLINIHMFTSIVFKDIDFIGTFFISFTLTLLSKKKFENVVYLLTVHFDCVLVTSIKQKHFFMF